VAPPQPAAAIPRRMSALWIETGLVLLLAGVPNLSYSIASLYMEQGTPSFVYEVLVTVVRSLGAIALVLFLVSRSGEPFGAFGLRRPRIVSDLLGGVGTFVLGMAGYYVTWYGLALLLGGHRTAVLARYDLTSLAPPSGTGSYALLAMMSILNGMAEEMVMRAYLIRRFEQLFRSTFAALVVAAALFASYHSYQGSGGVISAAALGLVYGAVFCVFRRLWPLAVGHAIQDFISLAMLER